MAEDRRSEHDPKTARESDVSFSDMVSLGPPPVPEDFDDTQWHAKSAQAKNDPELSNLIAQPSHRYQRHGELGQGGMATIYDSVDLQLRRHVAVKVIHPRQAAKDSDADERSPMQRFIQEAQITAQLEHPNIVPVHEIGIDAEGNAYFTMKRVEGRSLRDIFDDMRAGKAPVLAQYKIHTCLEVFIKVCDACAFAHSRNVVHRDLKPDNIMVGRFGEVQVMDWGLAKLPSDAAPTGIDELANGDTFTGRVSVHSKDAKRTIEGTISGTPAYMSPEQARGEVSKVDVRSDVFLLGALLYEMLTLVPPFHAESSMAALRKAQQHDLLPVSAMLERLLTNPELEDGTILHPHALERARQAQRELAAIAEHALARRPEDRYQTVEALIADIERFRRGEPVSVLRDAPLRAFGKWFTRHKLVTFAVSAGLVVALMASLVILVLERQNHRESLQQEQSVASAVKKANQLLESEATREHQERNREITEANRRSIEQSQRLAKLDLRRKARGYLDQANDKLARASDISDNSVNGDDQFNNSLRRRLRAAAINLLNLAITTDPDFGLPYVVRGKTHLQLGYLQLALDDLLHGTYIEREVEMLGDDPAVLMTIAMIALAENYMLGHGNWQNLYESALKRIRPRKESDASYFSLAAKLLEANTATRQLEATNDWREQKLLIDRISALTDEVATIQNQGTGLWEVHLFVGELRMTEAIRIGARDPSKARALLDQAVNDFQRAQRLSRQLPIVVRFLTRAELARKTLAGAAPNARSTTTYWDAYIHDFPDDPLGYYARARLPIEDLLGKRSDFWEASTRFQASRNDLNRALSFYPNFSEAIDTRGLLSQLEGNLELAYRDYWEAFGTWNPMLDLVPAHQPQHPAEMSLLERLLRVGVRLDAADGKSERTLATLKEAYQRCSEEDAPVSFWSNYQDLVALYRYAVSVALDEAAKRGHAELIYHIGENALPPLAEDVDQLAVARAFVNVGEFAAARERLRRVFVSNRERLALEERIDRLERARNGQYVELSDEELLFSLRMLSPSAAAAIERTSDLRLGVVGATRLANSDELTRSIEILVKELQTLTDAALRRDIAESIVRLYMRLQIEDPNTAKTMTDDRDLAAALREGSPS